jgi:hypothetical protein
LTPRQARGLAAFCANRSIYGAARELGISVRDALDLLRELAAKGKRLRRGWVLLTPTDEDTSFETAE